MGPRSTLALGCCDPVKRVRQIKERDPERQRIIEVFAAWWAKHGNEPVRVSDLDPAVLRAVDPKDNGRQYQARAVGNLVGTRLAGYALKRTGAIPNKRKEGALYQLEYRPPATDGSPASDGPSHPHYPHHPQEPAKDTTESTATEMWMTRGCAADDLTYPQSSALTANGGDASKINVLVNHGADNADDADGSPKLNGGKTTLDICAQCGQPGGTECAYGDHKAVLHPGCRDAWIAAYEASRNQKASRNGSVIGSSL